MSISVLFKSSYFQRWGHCGFDWEITDNSAKGEKSKKNICLKTSRPQAKILNARKTDKKNRILNKH